MPTDLILEDRSQFGIYRPGNVVTKLKTGLRRSRSFFEYNLMSYRMRFTPRGHSAENYEALMALMYASAASAVPFWIKEPISKPRMGVPGELTDGTDETFVNPLDTSSPTIFVGDGIVQTTPTSHAVANLMSDTQANAVGGSVSGLAAYLSCAISATRFPVLDGQFAILVEPTSGTGNVGAVATGSDKVSIASSQKYTVMASFLPTSASHTYGVRGQFYNGAAAGSSFEETDSGAVGEWLHLRKSATSSAGDDLLEVRAYRQDSSADDFVIACIGVGPGDLGRWFQPTLAPRAVEFSSAPDADKRLVFSAASCERWARVVMTSDQQMMTMDGLGNTTVQWMQLREVVLLP